MGRDPMNDLTSRRQDELDRFNERLPSPPALPRYIRSWTLLRSLEFLPNRMQDQSQSHSQAINHSIPFIESLATRPRYRFLISFPGG